MTNFGGEPLFGAGLLNPPKRRTAGLLIAFTHFGLYGPMPGMQHDNNIDGYCDQESKTKSRPAVRRFGGYRSPPPKRTAPNDSNFENASNHRPISLDRLV